MTDLLITNGIEDHRWNIWKEAMCILMSIFALCCSAIFGYLACTQDNPYIIGFGWFICAVAGLGGLVALYELLKIFIKEYELRQIEIPNYQTI